MFAEEKQSAEQRRRGDKCAASCGRKSAQHLYWHSEMEKLSTRPRRVGRRDYIQRPSRVCRKTYAQRSVGVRRKAPGAHAETEQMSTGRTRVRGVTKRKEAR